jgi:flagellar hook-associated protein 1 FlgK
MGIDNALTAALSGLRVNQESIALVSQNIANVNNANYSKRIVEQVADVIGGVGQGVRVKDITRSIDPFLQDSIRVQTAINEQYSIKNKYMDKVQTLLGTPDSNSNLNTIIDDFFSALKVLSVSPEKTSLRVDAVNRGKILADRIAGLARDLHGMRYDVDRAIKDAVDQINICTSNLQAVNEALNKSSQQSQSTLANLLEERDVILEELAKYIDISMFFAEHGEAIVSIAGGKSLVDRQYKYTLEYVPASSIDVMINNYNMNPIKGAVVQTGGANQFEVEFMSSGTGARGGQPSTVTTGIKTGLILGLKELRDEDLPLMIDELDTLAHNIRQEINAIHNSGTGFPPIQKMVGTRPVTSVDFRDYQGITRIGIIDKYGNPVKRPDGSYMKPLELNMSLLNSGNGAGKSIAVQSILDEINEYYYNAPVLGRTTLGSLYDVKLVAASNLSTAPNGQVVFDVEYNSDAQDDIQVQITSVSVSGSATGLVGSLPTAYNVDAGSRSRTGNTFTVDFAGGSGGPYDVDVTFQMTDKGGVVTTAIVTFNVDDTPGTLNVLNHRYVATAALGNATMIPPSTTQRYARASIVDEHGLPVANGMQGYLQIETTDSDYCLSIDDLSSKELGSPRTSTFTGYTATNKGFAEFFELNDLFVRNAKVASDGSGDSVIAGSAINMKVRNDIVTDPNLISLGSMMRSPDIVTTKIIGDVTASGTIKFSGIPSIGDQININGSIFTFVAVAGANDQITIGATLPATLTNMVAKLNAINAITSGKADKATYVSNGADSIVITYKSAGSIGNTFSLSATFATIGLAINSNPSSTTPSGNLANGSDKTVTTVLKSLAYEVGEGAKDIIDEMSKLSSKVIDFPLSGTLPANSNTLIGYGSAFISNAATQAMYCQNRSDKENLLLEGYGAKMQSFSGVNLDQELADTVKFQNAYAASARIINIVDKLFSVLLETF